MMHILTKHEKRLEEIEMLKKIVALLLLVSLVLLPITSEAATQAVRKKRTVSKYVTYKINGTAYTVSGTANYDKNGGLLRKDFVTWSGSVSHNKAECGTDYTMYIQEKKYKDKQHLPTRTGKKSFLFKKNVDTTNCYAKLIMDTANGKYALYVDE